MKDNVFVAAYVHGERFRIVFLMTARFQYNIFVCTVHIFLFDVKIILGI